MTVKSDFTEDEWSLLRETPPLAGLRVAFADDRSGGQESAAIAEVYGDAHERWWMTGRRGGLVDELLDEGPAFDASRYGSVDRPDGRAVIDAAAKSLDAAVSLLEHRATPEELAQYQAFVLTLAQRVAEVGRKGGFLGIGGSRVNTDEQAALDEIAAAFPAPPEPTGHTERAGDRETTDDSDDTDERVDTEPTYDAPVEVAENAR